MPVNYLSFKDLEKVVGFKSAKETNNIKEFERIIFENGADITKPYKIEDCFHRPRTSNIAYNGLRVVFQERLDRDWVTGKAASLDAYVEASGDISMVRELQSLNPRNDTSWDEEKHLSIEIPEDSPFDKEAPELEDKEVVILREID